MSEEEIKDLQQQLADEKQKNADLTKELEDLKDTASDSDLEALEARVKVIEDTFGINQ